MGKVKNLIWDEIEHDTEEPITPVPSWEDVKQAINESYQAVCLSGAGKAELETLAEYDIDPLADDAEEWVIEAIEDQCAYEKADFRRKVAA